MSNNLESKYEKYKDKLDQWIKFLGLPQAEPERSKIEEILELNNEDLKNSPPIELAEFAVMLSQYSFFLQKKYNECQSFLNWSKTCVSNLIAEDKPRLFQQTKEIEMRITMISFLTRRMDMMIQSLNNLSRMKYYQEREKYESS